MEQRFSNNSLDLQTLREFCEREGEAVFYRKGDQMEREGDPSRWFGFVTEGCFKYVTHEIGSDREHITWFSFEGENVGDYPSCLDGRPAQTSIEAMMPSRVLRVTGNQLMQLFRQDMETMELRSIIAEHLLCQVRRSYLELHRATPASVTSCCCAVVPESLTTCRSTPSPRSLASPCRCSPKSAKASLSTPSSSKTLKPVSYFRPRHPISGLRRGLFRGT